ncbi:hypothetical protein GCM10008101_26390 [Lysobacter xinjiangensis]|uniref:PKD domain-containing protein n=1 Tax=Cognatilysobacter xinjiangensis TaxID=546892 RepID=A0ABQ3CCP4_9GAMM|nr:hypothetical protein [Lysobacter xinjiangensis]GGZ70764.1 hypothetical protein GCM10008101_26390 [Lysobacter xinjiangensis]
MPRLRLFVFATLAAFVLAACNEGAEDMPAATSKTERPTGASTPSGVSGGLNPVSVDANAIAVGTQVNGDVAVRADSPQFTVNDTVYASYSEGRLPPSGGNARVYWTYQDGRTHKEETAKIEPGQQAVLFSFSAADGMKPGRYNVQIDINMRPVGIVDFQIR